jgi:hypothetical protein
MGHTQHPSITFAWPSASRPHSEGAVGDVVHKVALHVRPARRPAATLDIADEGTTMFAIHDEAIGTVLSHGHPSLDAAEQEMRRLLARLYGDVTATGDGCTDLTVDWTIRDCATGEIWVWRWGAPIPIPDHPF